MPFQPGNSHGTPWPKGVSGNPNGRPKMTPEQREARRKAKEEAAASVAVLVTLRDCAESEGVRRSAAVDLLRMAGVSFSEEETAPAAAEEATPARADMTAAELEAAASEGEA